MCSVIDLAQEPYVTLEVLPGQHQQYELLCSQNILTPVHVHLIVHEQGVCEVTYIQKHSIQVSIVYTAELIGSYASLTTKIRIVTADQHASSFAAHIIHTAAHTSSVFELKGVAYDASRHSFKGQVVLEKSAHHAQASLHHKHLVVGAQARVTSEPSLEASHHRVQCSHGSAISYVDDEQLFYAYSRGLDQQKAQSLLIESFLS